MIRHQDLAPALRRWGARAGAFARIRWLVVAVALLGQAWAEGSAPARAESPEASAACGDPALFGVAAVGHLDDDGTLTLTWTLVSAPVSTARMRPLVFVDGRLAVDLGPVELPCGQEVVRRVPGLAADVSVHAVLHNWPPVPTAMMGLSFEEAVDAFTLRWPPGTFAPADVEFWRPTGAGVPEPPARSDSRTLRPGEVPDDRVDARPGPEGERFVEHPADRMVRVPIASTLPIRLTYLAPDDARVRATCLLDGAQVPAFDGEVTRPALLESGRVLELDGEVQVPGLGWHRLHCLLLPDDPRPDPFVPLRPILALYLWGDGP